VSVKADFMNVSEADKMNAFAEDEPRHVTANLN
jgi:hypothetical protein